MKKNVSEVSGLFLLQLEQALTVEVAPKEKRTFEKFQLKLSGVI